MKANVLAYLHRIATRLLGRIKPAPAGALWPAREAWLAYVQAKRGWLTQFERLTSEVRPDLKQTVKEKFRLQLLYDERSALRLEHLIRHNPARVEVIGGLVALRRSIDDAWTESDTAVILREDGRYREIDEQIRLLRAQPEVSIREGLQQVEKSTEYAEALGQLRQRIRDIDALLGKRAA